MHDGKFSLPGEVRIPDGIVGAMILPVFTEGGCIGDFAAYDPVTGKMATWQGGAWALGHRFPQRSLDGKMGVGRKHVG